MNDEKTRATLLTSRFPSYFPKSQPHNLLPHLHLFSLFFSHHPNSPPHTTQASSRHPRADQYPLATFSISNDAQEQVSKLIDGILCFSEQLLDLMSTDRDLASVLEMFMDVDGIVGFGLGQPQSVE